MGIGGGVGWVSRGGTPKDGPQDPALGLRQDERRHEVCGPQVRHRRHPLVGEMGP